MIYDVMSSVQDMMAMINIQILRLLLALLINPKFPDLDEDDDGVEWNLNS